MGRRVLRACLMRKFGTSATLAAALLTMAAVCRDQRRHEYRPVPGAGESQRIARSRRGSPQKLPHPSSCTCQRASTAKRRCRWFHAAGRRLATAPARSRKSDGPQSPIAKASSRFFPTALQCVRHWPRAILRQSATVERRLGPPRAWGNVDDVGFVSAMISTISRRRYAPTRIASTATGFSNGAR